MDPGLGGVGGASSPVLSVGSGLNPDNSQYYSPGFLVYGTNSTSDLASAQSKNQYFQFTLTPTTGEALNVTSIDVANWFSQGFTGTMYATSSLNGFATSLGTTTLGGSYGVSSGNINLGGALQNLTSSVTIDLYVSGSWGYQTAGFGGPNTSGDSLQVIGSVSSPSTPLTWTGLNGSGGNGTWNTSLGNSWKATTGGAVATFSNADPVTFDSTGTNTNITVDSGGVNPGSITFSNGVGTAYAFTGGPIGGVGSVTLSGAGAVTFNSSNTYSGGTTITSGTLTAANDSALGTGTLIVKGGTVNLTSSSPSVSSLSGTGGTVVLSNTTLSVGSDNTSTSFTGKISQKASTSGGLIKLGTGSLSLGGSNTYTGNTLVSAGTLFAVNTTGSATGTGNLTVQSGATLGGSGLIGTAASSVTIQSGGILSPHLSSTGYSTLTINGALNLNAGSLLDFNLGSAGNDEVIANSVAFGGSSETLNIAFPNGVTAGLFPILKASSFSGQASPVFTINGPASESYSVLAPGAVGNTFSNTYALQATSQTLTWTGANNDFTGVSAAWDTTTANWNNPTGTAVTYADGNPVLFNDTALNYDVVIEYPGVQPGSITFQNSIGHNYTVAGRYNFGPVISGSTAVYVDGTGTVNFVTPGDGYQQNTYTGGTFLNAGVLVVDADNRLGTAPAGNAVNLTFNGGTLRSALADLSISPTRGIQLNAGGGTLDTNANEIDFTGNLIQGPGALTIIGGGILKFYNGYYNSPQGNLDQNTYTGGTTVNGTTVQISDNGAGSVVSAGAIVSSIFGTGPITFNNGSGVGTFQYAGLQLANAVTFNGSFTYTFNWASGDEGHGLVLSTTDASGNATTTPNKTTIGASGATLNLVTVSPGEIDLGQQVVGGRLTINTTGTALVSFDNSSNTFAGITLNSGLVVAGSVSAIGNGVMTVNGGAAIFRNTSPSTVFAMLQSGSNGGAWNGTTGINSTAAASNPLYAVGMYQPPAGTTFENQNLATVDVAIKYTYYGDANLDGKVDGSDYSMIDNGVLTGATGWQNGDFNYDGVINGSDYTLIDNAYNTQGAQISDEVATANAQIAGGAGASSVPEPAELGLLAIGAIGLLGRRSRRHAH